MQDNLDLLKRLIEEKVEFTVIGGVAAVFHGSSIVTHDLDVCAPLDEANTPRILAALRQLHPYHRMRPDKLPLPDDPTRLKGFKNLYVRTDNGTIDFLGELTGVGAFGEAITHSLPAKLGPDIVCPVLDLETLIMTKRLAGRHKDLRVAAELEVIRERRKR